MCAGDADTSSMPDDGCHVHRGQGRTFESPNERQHVPSICSHERYQSKHLEMAENATDTLSDNEGDSFSLMNGWKRTPPKFSVLVNMLVEMQKKVSALEERAKGQGDKTHDRGGSSSMFGAEPARENDQRPVLEDNTDAGFKQTEIIPEIHERTWTEFMNKCENVTTEYAIEVLIGEPVYKRKSDRKIATTGNPWEKKHAASELVADSARSSPPLLPNDEVQTIPDRIRINSTRILGFLAAFDKNIETSEPLVMYRPFKLLTHFEEKIKSLVSGVQEESGTRTPASMLDGYMESDTLTNSPLSPESGHDDDDGFAHIQCLIHFIDQYIKPTVKLLQSPTAKKIYFRDLWHIFQPGENIFMPLKDRQYHVSLDPMTATPEMFQSRYERMWRVIGTGGGRPNLTSHDRDGHPKLNPFQVNCYYIDFDGLYFFPVVHTFSISPFVGQQDIVSLELFPLRFLRQGLDLWRESQAQGKLVFDALLSSHTHFYYQGPTLATQPCGCPLQSDNVHQEHVESEVIIDYRTTLLKHPSWRPKQSFWKLPPHHPDELQEKFRIRYWVDDVRSKLSRSDLDFIYDDSEIDKEKALTFRDNSRIFDRVPTGWLSNEKSVPETDIAMLSPRVFAFVLRTRSFAPVWMWGLQKISAQTDGLNNLQLENNNFKETIHALVRTHFLQLNSSRQPEFEYDVVRGKGKGLVFLLHGAPGVGKTFTAESVAAANGRPLFQITCGDLGLTPSEVEKALKEIFRYAQLWNCVLLLDECDIFLTQRTKTDLKRNSLVSVFLRVLEWYNGVLFLTTNRVGALDSAVRSRITWSIFYPSLNWKQSKRIWRTNLDLLEQRYSHIELSKEDIMKFAKDHYKNGNHWNGRQIQNAFKVSVSLANWDTLSSEEQHATDTKLPKNSVSRDMTVTASHFQTVAVAAKAFDDYLHQATGLTEAQRAFHAQERDDNYMNEESLHEAVNATSMPEPPPKKRRTSTITSPTPQPPPAFATNQARRSSQSQPTQPKAPSRRSSIQMHNTVVPPIRTNGKGLTRKPSGGMLMVESPVASNPPSNAFKRKRSGTGQFGSLNGAIKSSDSADSDSESELDAIIGTEYPPHQVDSDSD